MGCNLGISKTTEYRLGFIEYDVRLNNDVQYHSRVLEYGSMGVWYEDMYLAAQARRSIPFPHFGMITRLGIKSVLLPILGNDRLHPIGLVTQQAQVTEQAGSQMVDPSCMSTSRCGERMVYGYQY